MPSGRRLIWRSSAVHPTTPAAAPAAAVAHLARMHRSEQIPQVKTLLCMHKLLSRGPLACMTLHARENLHARIYIPGNICMRDHKHQGTLARTILGTKAEKRAWEGGGFRGAPPRSGATAAAGRPAPARWRRCAGCRARPAAGRCAAAASPPAPARTLQIRACYCASATFLRASPRTPRSITQKDSGHAQRQRLPRHQHAPC